MGTLIFCAAVAALWMIFVVTMWCFLLFEKRSPLTLVPMPADHMFASDAYIAKMRKEAEGAGLVSLGTYVDPGSGWIQGTMDLWLSADGLTLLTIVRGRALRKIALRSAMTDDVWLVTMSTVADPDCTGLSAEEGMPTITTFAPVLARHRERIAGREEEIIPWNPEEVVDDLVERDRRRAQRLIETGMARVRDGMTGRWSYTVKGAARQRAAMKAIFRKTMAAAKAEQEEKKRAKKMARQKA